MLVSTEYDGLARTERAPLRAIASRRLCYANSAQDLELLRVTPDAYPQLP